MIRQALRLPIAIARAIKDTWLARAVWANPISAFSLLLMPSAWLADRIYKFRYQQITFYSRKLDWNAVDEVILRGEYDEILLAFSVVKKMVILDLGANIGSFSIKAFTLLPDAIIHAVEPSLGTFQILDKNRDANPDLQWQAYRYAIWNKNESVSFHESAAASTGSYLDQGGDTAQVPAIRLTTMVEQNVVQPVDLIKMDIEGAEEVVLFDSIDLLKAAQGLILEIHHYRCDEAKIRHLLYREFPFVYEIMGRVSNKPLLVASRMPLDLVHAVLMEPPDAFIAD
jgi:FkbM family methyltransferase